MKKKLVQLTLLLSLLGGTTYFAQQQPLLPSGSCCARICGDDKECYRACTHDPGGPCSNNAKKPAKAKKTAPVQTAR